MSFGQLVTTDASPRVLFTSASAKDSAAYVRVTICAGATDGSRATFVREFVAKRVGGTVSLVGSVGATFTASDVGGWVVSISVVANQVSCSVTGDARTVTWAAVSVEAPAMPPFGSPSSALLDWPLVYANP